MSGRYDWPPPTEPPVRLPPPAEGPGPPPWAAGPAGPVRPWWGMGDALLILPITGVVFAVTFLAVGVLAAIESVDLAELSAEDAALPASLIVIPTIIQQAAWFGWPFVVSRWKGLGPAADWGWSFRWSDIGVGLGVAMIGMFAAGVAGFAASELVGLEDQATADNTAIVTDLQGSPWLWGLVFIVVVGAPFSEELLFRGLILRSAAKRWGTAAGVVVSLLAFVPIHLADGGVLGDDGLLSDGQIVLWATIGTLGLVLAIAAVSTGRLVAPIVAHMVVNALGVAGALGLWGDLSASLGA